MVTSWASGRHYVRSVAGRQPDGEPPRPLADLPAPLDPEGLLRCPAAWSPRVLALNTILAAAWLDHRRRLPLAEVAALIGMPEREVIRWLGPLERQGHGHIRATVRGGTLRLEAADATLERPERFAPSRLPAARLAAAPDTLTARAWLAFEAAAARKHSGHRWVPEAVPAGPRRREQTSAGVLARLLGLPDGSDPATALAAALPWVRQAMPGYRPEVRDGMPWAPPLQRRSGWVPRRVRHVHGTIDAWGLRLHWVPASRAYEEAVLEQGLRGDPGQFRTLWLAVAAWLADPAAEWPFDARYLRPGDVRAAFVAGGPAAAYRQLIGGLLRASGATRETPAGVPWRVNEEDRQALEEAADVRSLGEEVRMPDVRILEAKADAWLCRERSRLYRVTPAEIVRRLPDGLTPKTRAALERLAVEAAAMPSKAVLKLADGMPEDLLVAAAGTLTRKPHLARHLAAAWRAAVNARRPELPEDAGAPEPCALPMSMSDLPREETPDSLAGPRDVRGPEVATVTDDGLPILRRVSLGDWMHEVLELEGENRVVGIFGPPDAEVAAAARAAGFRRAAPAGCDVCMRGDAAALMRFLAAWDAAGTRIAA